jgi:hypothetical protein
MTRVVLAAAVILGLAAAAFFVLRASSPDALSGPGSGLSTATGAVKGTPALPGSTAPASASPTATPNGEAPAGPNAEGTSEDAGGEVRLTVVPTKAEGTPEALNAQLQAARTAADAKARDAAIGQAWNEYVALGSAEGGEAVRAAALDELVALYQGEQDAGIRRGLLDRISFTGTDAVEQLLFEAARAGRTEPERLSAIHNLGKLSEPGTVTARVYLHPQGPDQVTAARDVAKLRERARAELTRLQGTVTTEAEQAAVELALARLAAGEKR